MGKKTQSRDTELFFNLGIAFFESSVMLKSQNFVKDALAMVKHACLEHVYIKKRKAA